MVLGTSFCHKPRNPIGFGCPHLCAPTFRHGSLHWLFAANAWRRQEVRKKKVKHQECVSIWKSLVRIGYPAGLARQNRSAVPMRQYGRTGVVHGWNRKTPQMGRFIGISERENGGARRNRTADDGFADHCLATWRPRHRPKRAGAAEMGERVHLRRPVSCSALQISKPNLSVGLKPEL
jgi:hypothetical protein